ncbi:MAG: PAS domain S-box protein, partial [Sneathiella sp.]|nr:PAS domain S-box protein [Sneathiella sp.]
MQIGIESNDNGRFDFQSRRFYTLIAIVALLVGFVTSSYFLYLSSQALTKSAEQRYSSYLLADELRQSSDDLTRMVRTFAATGDPRFEQQFFSVLAIRNGHKQRPENYHRIYWDFVAILKSTPENKGDLIPLRQLMVDEGISENELALLKKAQEQSDNLVALENVAMRAINDTLTNADEKFRKIGESNREMAIRVLHGPEYHQAKVSIMEPLQKFLVSLDVRTNTEIKQQANRTNLLLVLCIGIIFGVIILTIYGLRLHQRLTNYEKSQLDGKNKELKTSEDNLNLLVQTQTDLISRFSPDGILNFVNKSYAEFLGKDIRQLIGISIFTAIPPEEHELVKTNFARLSRDCPTFTTENHNENDVGEFRVLEWINHAYFDDDGNVSEIQAVGRDVTEFRQALDRADAANIAKSEFLSTMSHEIRTPLNGVLGIAQLLKDTKLDKDQQRMLTTILSSGQTLLAIINDVLDMSKIEAGGMELEEKAFCLNVLVPTITTPFQSLSDDKGLELVVNSEVKNELVVRGDPIRLRQIIWNLLSNAIKFTKEGQVSLSITFEETSNNENDLENDPKNHLICFAVEDTGDGIAPDRVGAIFGAFIQEDSSITRKYGGTGLGLSIVKQLTELMGGTIKVDSELEKGTKFSVYIPFEATTQEEAEAVNLRDVVYTRQKQQPLNILLAEDNEVNAVIAKAFLEKFGHSVKHVENGLLAIEAVKKNWADLVLMDIH